MKACVSICLALCLAVLLVTCGRSPVAPTPAAASPSLVPVRASATAVVARPASATPVPTMPRPTATSRPAASATAAPAATVTAPPGAISAANAQEVIELSRWGRGWVRRIIYAPDGREVAVVTSLGLYIYDAQTLDLLRSVMGQGWDYSVAFSPDWTTLAWASGSEMLLLDASDGSPIRSFAGEPGRLGTPVFSADGSLLAVIRFPPGEEVYTGAAELWRVADGRLLARWECDGSHVAFAPDGGSLATWYTMTGIRLWDLPGGELLQHVDDWVDDVTFSPDGELIAYASMTKVRMWQVAGWNHAFDLESSLPNMRALAFSPDGTRLAAVASTGQGQVWQVASGQVLTGFGPEAGTSYGALAFAPDGQTLASAAMDLQFWRLPEGELTRVLEGFFPPVGQVATSADGSTVAAVMDGGSVWLLDAESGGRQRVPVDGQAISLAVAPDGSQLALGLWDFSVQLLSLPGGEVLQAMTGHPVQVQSVAFSPDGLLLASSSMEEVRLWRTEDGGLLHTLRVPNGGWIESAVFSPDGALVAALASNGRVLVWQVSGGDLLQTLQAPDDGYSGQVAFSPDGGGVALAKHDLVLVWQIGTGNLVESYEVPEGTSQVAFSPDGSLLVNGAGPSVQLRERAGGGLLASLGGSAEAITGLAFAAGGRFLVSSSWDGTVRVWGLPGPKGQPGP